MSSANEMIGVSNVLVGMYVHYLLYVNKKTKSYSVMTSTDRKDIERRVAYMIKSMIKKTIDDNPAYAQSVSAVGIRYGQININFNYLGGSMWSEGNDTFNKLCKGYSKHILKTKHFPNMENSEYPLNVDVNISSISFSMARDYYSSDAASSMNTSRRGNHIDTDASYDIQMPLKDKVKALYTNIVKIPEIVTDMLDYRTTIRTRMLDDNSGSIKPDFRYNILDIYLGHIEGGNAAQVFGNSWNNSNNIGVTYLREITLMLKALIDANLPAEYYTETQYPFNNSILTDFTKVSSYGRGTEDAARNVRIGQFKEWIKKRCEDNNVGVIGIVNIDPPADTLDEADNEEAVDDLPDQWPEDAEEQGDF